MDLSLTKPYPGENKLPDRLLAIKEVNEKYQKLLKELAATVVHEGAAAQGRRGDRAGDEGRSARRKRRRSAARKEPPPGFGGRAAWAAAARPEDVRREADRVGRGAARRHEQGLRPAAVQLRPARRRVRRRRATPADRREDVPRQRRRCRRSSRPRCSPPRRR